MKTIPLEEALRLATSRPFTAARSPVPMIRGSDSWTVCYAPNTRTLDVPNMALLAHFYNHGPELVETLKRLLNNTPDAGFVKTTPQFLTAYTSALDQARAVLSEASTVQMP